jgi:hypothetical protein
MSEKIGRRGLAKLIAALAAWLGLGPGEASAQEQGVELSVFLNGARVPGCFRVRIDQDFVRREMTASANGIGCAADFHHLAAGRDVVELCARHGDTVIASRGKLVSTKSTQARGIETWSWVFVGELPRLN